MYDRMDRSVIARLILAIVVGTILAFLGMWIASGFDLHLNEWTIGTIFGHFKNPEWEPIQGGMKPHHLEPWKGIWQLMIMFLPGIFALTAVFDTSYELWRIPLRALASIIVNGIMFLIVLLVEMIRSGQFLLMVVVIAIIGGALAGGGKLIIIIFGGD